MSEQAEECAVPQRFLWWRWVRYEHCWHNAHGPLPNSPESKCKALGVVYYHDKCCRCHAVREQTGAYA